MPVSEIIAPPLPPPGPPQRSNGRTGVMVAVIVGVIALVGLVMAVLAGLILSTTVERTSEITTERSGCFNRDSGGELCFHAADGVVTIAGRGLMPESTLTITGDNGDFLNSEVDVSGLLSLEVSGTVVDRSFTMEGLWADGQAAVLISEAEEQSAD